jgi:hypothetical protein
MKQRVLTVMAAAIAFALLSPGATDKRADGERVVLHHISDQALQPQIAVDRTGTLHVVYYSGAPGNGDLYYVRSTDGGATYSTPLRVNSQQGSAVAAGTIRGAQVALGKNGR